MIRRVAYWLLAGNLLLLGIVPAVAQNGNERHPSDDYVQTNLVSDIAGVALNTDKNLVNPWGLTFGPTTPFWVANNGTGTATVYDGNGEPVPSFASPLVVTIQPPMGAKQSAPTGAVFNSTSAFKIGTGSQAKPAVFLFSTEDGTIAAWNPKIVPTTAILVVDRSTEGAVYKGLALGRNDDGVFLFATNFHDATVDVFDKHFHLVQSEGGFIDPEIPAGFAPFGIQNIEGKLFVTYAKQNAEKHDDVAGPGNGFVDVFDTEGHLLRRFATQGTLNSPWGVALAPDDFGRFSHHLLVGNFGDGRINVFDFSDGDFDGQLENVRERPITINGLWSLKFGNGNRAGNEHTLFFTAGIVDEAHGLFGKIQPLRRHCEDCK